MRNVVATFVFGTIVALAMYLSAQEAKKYECVNDHGTQVSSEPFVCVTRDIVHIPFELEDITVCVGRPMDEDPDYEECIVARDIEEPVEYTSSIEHDLP